MSLLLDSEAQLEARAKEIGLADEVIAALQNAGVKNMSQLAFAVGQPGEPLSNQEIDRFLANVLSRPAVLAESTGVRRLAFEAQTFVIASLRQVIEQKDDGAPKKIGAAERETRMNAIKLELGGLSISDDNEPSHALLEVPARFLKPTHSSILSQQSVHHVPKKSKGAQSPRSYRSRVVQ